MIHYQFFEAGFCRHCERMTLLSGHLKQREYPSMCALIKHETLGYILFDTGYSERFVDLTQKFPFSLYRHLTPVTIKKTLKTQLLENNIQPTDIKFIVISHFHADHIGGLRDFPNAQFICHPDAIHQIKNISGFKGLVQGFLPGLLPADFYERVILLDKNQIELEENLHPFTHGFDLFNDQQLIAIPLPGHTKGHFGLYCKAALPLNIAHNGGLGDSGETMTEGFQAKKDIFLVADSCWHQESFKNLDYPSQLTYLIHDNKSEYIQTIQNLHTLYQHNQHIAIIPSHCVHVRQHNGEQTSC